MNITSAGQRSQLLGQARAANSGEGSSIKEAVQAAKAEFKESLRELKDSRTPGTGKPGKPEASEPGPRGLGRMLGWQLAQAIREAKESAGGTEPGEGSQTEPSGTTPA